MLRKQVVQFAAIQDFYKIINVYSFVKVHFMVTLQIDYANNVILHVVLAKDQPIINVFNVYQDFFITMANVSPFVQMAIFHLAVLVKNVKVLV